MATTQTPPFARLTRGGFGFSSKSRYSKSKVVTKNDDEWYIPYNGPYEAPRQRPRRQTARDSWGDPVEDYDEHKELRLRYGGLSPQSGRLTVEEERKSRSRDRAQSSAVSNRTTSSGAVDPSRLINVPATSRRSTVSSGNPAPRPPVPSYGGNGGGVGESPVPNIRYSKDNNRISIATLFSFSGSVRRPPSSPGTSNGDSGLTTNTTRKPNILSRSKSAKSYALLDSPQPRGSSSAESRRNNVATAGKENKLQQLHEQVVLRDEHVSIQYSGTDEEDYYNSYYSTLMNKPEPKPEQHVRLNSQVVFQPQSPSSSGDSHRDFSGISRKNSTSTSSGRHPYAYAFPRIDVVESPPKTAPLRSTSDANHPRLTFTVPQQSSDSDVKYLKNSTSTPNLRPLAVPQLKIDTNVLVSPAFKLPTGKDRWLSAETWCDALLFPRPRLKLKNENESSGRIVSPPSSPVDQGNRALQQDGEIGFVSRVLAHSRSLVDLNKGATGKESISYPVASTSQYIQSSRAQPIPYNRPPRPKSFAQDDLALPTPVPSLAHVLQEGDLLESERRKWQAQALNSIGNKRARSLSRTRTKSMTQKGRYANHNHQTSVEYMAARACLGNQNFTPTISSPRLNANLIGELSSTSNPLSKNPGQHSRNNSLAKSLHKSSKSHSGSHSRNDSWSKPAMKVAALCGYPEADDAPTNTLGKTSDLEDALKRDGTKVIRLADPAYLPVDRGHADYNRGVDHAHPIARGLSVQNNLQYERKTPTPSEISDSKVGVALGTPPEEEETVNYTLSHPYAHGGLSFSNAPSSSAKEHRHADFAGPHPSVNTGVQVPQISEILARHKLPPHMVLHPYAQSSTPPSRDSYLDANGLIGQYRTNENTPRPSKMWAQLSPGVVREILPADLQYSPFLSENEVDPQDSIVISDIVGVGETLVKASRHREDSSNGTSDGHGSIQPSHVQQMAAQQSWEERPEEEIEEEEDDLAEFGPIVRSRRHGIQFNLPSREDDIQEDQDGSQASASTAVIFSNMEQLRAPSSDDPASTSPASRNSSLQPSPQPLGSPNDLDSFQDLFYRPSVNNMSRIPHEAALPETPSSPHHLSTLSWDLSNRRTGSSLTSLARQLTDELEQMTLERERSSTQSLASSRQPSGILRRPTDDRLQFVFEEIPVPLSPQDESLSDRIHAFKPSDTLPEDIQTSRASSFIEATDDDTSMFRVGQVESVATPPTVSQMKRHSFNSQSAYIHDQQELRNDEQIPDDSNSRNILSGLQPPSENTRSSYMTTSTTSRMSALFDFPSPPKDDYVTPKHLSMLSSYFDETLSQSESLSNPLPPPQLPLSILLGEHDVTFGGDLSASDVAETLSSGPHL